jgi:uncharacterized membrane protein
MPRSVTIELSDWILIIVRWLHTLAAVAWVGGSFFFLVVLRPTINNTPQAHAINRIAGSEFRNLVDTSIWAILVTGVILSIDRLGSGHATGAYGAILGIKIALAILMFYMVWFRQNTHDTMRSKGPTEKGFLIQSLKTIFSTTNLILILGVTVILLADILRHVFERSLAL